MAQFTFLEAAKSKFSLHFNAVRKRDSNIAPIGLIRLKEKRSVPSEANIQANRYRVIKPVP